MSGEYQQALTGQGAGISLTYTMIIGVLAYG
jgi:hypothetical protein